MAETGRHTGLTPSSCLSGFQRWTKTQNLQTVTEGFWLPSYLEVTRHGCCYCPACGLAAGHAAMMKAHEVVLGTFMGYHCFAALGCP